jgi:16S rRNA (cytosine967-C5)-methyltransferase
MPPTARQLALQTLALWKTPDSPPLIPERDDPEWALLSARDRGVAFDLITGVLRRRLLLDALIASQLSMPIEKLDTSVRAILWIGLYQLLFHASAPSYATVHSTVELAKSSGHERAAGLVNAVLRAVTRLTPALEIRHGLSAATFPRDFTYQLQLNKPIFPDPAKDVVAHLATVTSHPPELIKMLIKSYGEADITSLLIRNNQRPVIILRADDPTLAVPPKPA